MKFFSFLAIFLIPGLVYGLSLKDLSQDEMTRLEKGEFILKKKNIEGESWAELYGYALVEATALESVAIFSAYDHQQDYIPKMLKSIPVEQKSPGVVIVQYEMRLPWPLPNTRYVHEISLTKPEANHYLVKWKSLSSNSADEMQGEAHFIQRADKALWLYRSFVRPKSFLAGFFEKSMIKDVGHSLRAIRKYIHFAKRKNPQLMQKYIGSIESSLNGKYFYRNKETSKK